MQDVKSLLIEIVHLLKLNGENPFKIKAFDKAVHLLEEVEDVERKVKDGSIIEVKGIGKGISDILHEYYHTGEVLMVKELREKLPLGLEELSSLPGLGPKKAKVLIEKLSVHSLVELEYACRENRLVSLKGFGEKLQNQILEAIEFKKTTQGQMLLLNAYPIAEKIFNILSSNLNAKLCEVGPLRRRLEVVDRFSFLVESGMSEKAQELLKDLNLSLPIEVHESSKEEWGYWQVFHSSSEEFFKSLNCVERFDCETEEEFFEKLELDFIPAEMRESQRAIELAKKGQIDEVVGWDDIKGVFHMHTTYSDGKNTIEQMVIKAISLGLEYIGISEHSQSAFYADGLKPEALKQQKKELDQIQKKYPEIKIFWGIESDILVDGTLDYADSVLADFDFVIASIHSRFKKNKNEMTERIVKAIQHPATRFVGHPSGRLLLGRPPFDCDMKKIIFASAEQGVVMEINASPYRLDLDWRHGKEIFESKCLVSINPDAHSVEDLENTTYGIAVARKALILKSQVLNTKSRIEIEEWLRQ